MNIFRAIRFYSGFCISELIIAISLMGILGAIAIPMISSSQNASALKEAKIKAHILNCAKESYRLRTGDHNQEYTIADEKTRFKLLEPYMRQNAKSLDSYCPKSYQFILGSSVQANVQLLYQNGQQIVYLIN